MTKKILAFVSVALLFSLCAFAEPSMVEVEDVRENVAELNLSETDASINALASGYCGEDAKWSFDGSTLTIYGSGYMWDYGLDEEDYPPWDGYWSSIKSVVINSAITGIGEYAFSYYPNLSSVSIGNSVEYIGAGAFLECRKLTNVMFPDSLVNIYSNAFNYCTSLTSITIPRNVEYISPYAFLWCFNIKSYYVDSNNRCFSRGSYGELIYHDESGEKYILAYPIGNSATTYTVPDDCGYNHNAFRGCKNLTRINDYLGLGLLIGAAGQGDSESYKVIQYPIGSTNSSIRISDMFSVIGTWAFAYNKSLTSVTMSEGVKVIEWGAFMNCTGLTSVTIPKSVTIIEDYAFDSCNSNLTIYGHGGSYAEDYAFENDIKFVEIYEITLDLAGGEAEYSSTTTTGSKTYGTLPTPTKQGYTFDGWYSGSGVKVVTGQAVAYNGNHTLYARYTPNRYTVTLNANGGTVSPYSVYVTYDSVYSSLPKPTRAGFTFEGWYTQATGGECIKNGDTVKITSNTVLYAHWIGAKYTVSFADSEGMPIDIENIQVEYGKPYGMLPKPSEPYGYDFDGWYTARTGGTKITDVSTVNISTNVTLYARFKPKAVTVTFDVGEFGRVNPTSMVMNYGSTYTNLPTPTTSETGTSFYGWYTPNYYIEAGEAYSVSIAEDHTLMAAWGPTRYKLTLNANGGSIYEWDDYTQTGKYVTTSTHNICYGESYYIINNNVPERLGYYFAGWYTAAAGGVMVNWSDVYTKSSNQTLYAHWEPRDYYVEFWVDGGELDSDYSQVFYDSTFGILPVPTKQGYSFDGWYYRYYDENIGMEKEVKIANNARVRDYVFYDHIWHFVLEAHWIANKYRITFNGNGGNVSSSVKTVTYDEEYGTLPTSTRTGYNFSGWYTAIEGGTVVKSDDKVLLTSDTTLYARWIGKDQKIKLDATGGSVLNSEIDTKYGDKVGTLPTPTRKGYVFDGWYDSKTGGNKINPDHTVKSDMQLYARWNVKEVMVTFDGGIVEMTESQKIVKYDTPYGILPEPEKIGYIFIGWYYDVNCQNPAKANDLVKTEVDHTLYAKWCAQEFDIEFNAAGGQVSAESRHYVVGQTDGDLPVPSRKGYDFLGWYTSDVDGTKISSAFDILVDTTLYAHWSIKVETGLCGENITYTLTGEEKLVISGTGEMKNYSSVDKTPWKAYACDIREIIVENGVTSIGDMAFADCTSITSFDVAKSIETIGTQAFANCENLQSVSMFDNVSAIEHDAFAGCDVLTIIGFTDSYAQVYAANCGIAFEGVVLKAGDADYNGVVDVYDICLLADILSGKNSDYLYTEQADACDLHGDDTINIKDLIKLALILNKQ